jgi:hypothetical protein
LHENLIKNELPLPNVNSLGLPRTSEEESSEEEVDKNND